MFIQNFDVRTTYKNFKIKDFNKKKKTEMHTLHKCTQMTFTVFQKHESAVEVSQK
jgi:hypothetical protein